MKINIGLLIKVLSIQSKSNDDAKMHEFLKDWLTTNKLKYEEDDYGNLYVTKGKAKSYPCVVAHTDTVHSIIKDKYFRVFKLGMLLYAMNTSIGKQTGIGGDDKVGVFACLHALKNHKNIKVAFFRNEEVGCIGSNYSIKNYKDFYKNVNFVIQCDRRGNSDFLTRSGGIKMCSDEFIEATKPYVDKYKFKKESGISTDVDKLVREGLGVSAVNLSSGYWYAHTSSEIVRIDEVQNVINLVDDIIINLGNTRFEYKYEKPTYNYSSNYNSSYRNFNRYGINAKIMHKRRDNWNERFRRIPKIGLNIVDEVESRILGAQMNIEKDIMYLPKDTKLPIKMPGNCECVKNSKINHEIVYLMEEDIFFCLACQRPVAAPNMNEKFYKEMTIKDNGKEFVYNNMSGFWLAKDDAIWKDTTGSYISKRIDKLWG